MGVEIQIDPIHAFRDEAIADAFREGRPATSLYPEAASEILFQAAYLYHTSDLRWDMQDLRDSRQPVTVGDLPEELQRELIDELLLVESGHVTGTRLLTVLDEDRAMVLDAKTGETEQVSTDQIFLTR